MNIQKTIGLFSFLFLFAGVVQAAPKKETKSSSKPIEITLKKVEGQINWTGYGVGKSHSGTIKVKSGEIVLGDKDIPQKINFVLDMKSLDTQDSS